LQEEAEVVIMTAVVVVEQVEQVDFVQLLPQLVVAVHLNLLFH
jgi:hypothetical protein